MALVAASIALITQEWKAFCDLEKGKDISDLCYKLTREQVKSIVCRYMFVYYNRIRMSSVNPGGMSQVVYRECAKTLASTAV